MKTTSVIAFILVIIGALNWLLIGLFSFNLVSVIFGPISFISRTIYTLVGIASLWIIFFIFAFRPFKNINE